MPKGSKFRLEPLNRLASATSVNKMGHLAVATSSSCEFFAHWDEGPPSASRKNWLGLSVGLQLRTEILFGWAGIAGTCRPDAAGLYDTDQQSLSPST
jgi:hypothetical protein